MWQGACQNIDSPLFALPTVANVGPAQTRPPNIILILENSSIFVALSCPFHPISQSCLISCQSLHQFSCSWWLSAASIPPSISPAPHPPLLYSTNPSKLLISFDRRVIQLPVHPCDICHDQVGWGPEQPALVEDVPAYGRMVGTG